MGKRVAARGQLPATRSHGTWVKSQVAKDEGRRTKDEGRRTKGEGRRAKDEGRKIFL
ncbi:MAG: hypothetical protein QMD08_00415 [Actinomycetota bacterium]|nr:hypothetical protein [Actinomycetota bacterium]